MTEPKEALKPCPFCGGEAQWVEDHGRLNEPFGLIVNHKPECWWSDNLPAFERDAMIAAWNTRAEAAENAALRENLAEREWQPIETAPRDGAPILACCHYGCSDPECPYSDEDYMPSDAWRKPLCVFHAHAEGLSQVEGGLQVVVWGGGWADGWEDGGGSLPDWWFRYGSEFEEAANPTHWMPLPEPPALTGDDNAEG